MKLTSEVIETTISEIRDYQRTHFGVQYGPDFPGIAEELAKSKAFSDACISQSMMGLVALMSLPRKEEGGLMSHKAEHFMDELKSSPVRYGLALMFYAGFKLGQRFAETEQLEKLAKNA